MEIGGKPDRPASERDDFDSAYIQEPSPASIAALEFQVASLLNDQRSVLNWNGREIVVNAPGDLKQKLRALHQIAERQFPRRGEVDDVLSETIQEYSLWRYANPLGFWKAFKRNMIDAVKAAFESKRIHSGTAGRVGHEPEADGVAQSVEALNNGDAVRTWQAEQASELHAADLSAAEKWDLALSSDGQLDRLICESAQGVMADDEYLEELSHESRQVAKLTRLVAEIRFRTGCSQADAYRQLERFRERHATKSSTKVRNS